MLLTLSRDLLCLISYHLSMDDWLRLIQCHSSFRFLTNESYWHHRLYHDTKSLDYVRAKPESLTWRQWYLVSRRRLRVMNLGTYQDKDICIRPWYISQYFVVDMLGQTYYWLPIDSLNIELHQINISFKKMIGRCLKSQLMHHLIIDNKQQLIAVQSLFHPGPYITLLHSEVSEAVHLENGHEHVIVISTIDQRLLYFRGDVNQLLNTPVWNPIPLSWKGEVRCLSAWFSTQSDNLEVELITNEGVHHISTLSFFGWYSGIKPNKLSYVYIYNNSTRLAIDGDKLSIHIRESEYESVSQSFYLKWSNGVAQIHHNGVTMCPYNFVRGKNYRCALGLVLNDK